MGTAFSPPRDFNAATHYIDVHLDTGRRDKIALVDDNGRYTYAEVAERVNRAGNALLDLGLAPESRIGMVMNDSVEFVALFWGSIKAGLVPVPINTLLSEENYRYIVTDSRVPTVAISGSLLPGLLPALREQSRLRQILVVGDEQSAESLDTIELLNYAALSDAASAQLEAASTSADDVAFWLYSSGSTGSPKGVRHLHRNLVCTAECFGKSVLNITENDVVFSAAKLFFAYGLGNAMTFPFAVGATSVVRAGRPTPEMVLDVIEKESVTLYFGVPTLYAAMLAAAEGGNTPENLGAVRLCVSAGEALPADIGRRWRERYGVDIVDGVGSTELLHIFLSNRPGNINYGTSGVAVPGYELRLVDDDGADVPDGEIGELLVNGGSSAEGYWNQRDKSLATFAGSWTYTGDKYVRDQTGAYRFCGRGDDMFKSGGNWVSPFDVEASLVEHEAVLEAAVVAHPDEHGNLKPKAFVVLNEGFAADVALGVELQEYVKAKIERWKYPRWVEFVTDLPKTATGKIQRFKLR